MSARSHRGNLFLPRRRRRDEWPFVRDSGCLLPSVPGDPVGGRGRTETWAVDVPFGIAGTRRERHWAWSWSQAGKIEVICYYTTVVFLEASACNFLTRSSWHQTKLDTSESGRTEGDPFVGGCRVLVTLLHLLSNSSAPKQPIVLFFSKSRFKRCFHSRQTRISNSLKQLK